MSLDQLKKIIEENKDDQEIQAYLQGLNPITVEGVQKFLSENQEGTRWLDSEKDKHTNKALETWKLNNLKKLVDDKVKELYPDETPEQKRLRELELKLEEAEKKSQRETLRNTAFTSAEGKVPKKIVDFFIGDDDDSTLSNINLAHQEIENFVAEEVERRFKEKGRTPPPGNGGSNNFKNPWSKESLNLTEQGRILRNDPELAKQLQAQAK